MRTDTYHRSFEMKGARCSVKDCPAYVNHTEPVTTSGFYFTEHGCLYIYWESGGFHKTYCFCNKHKEELFRMEAEITNNRDRVQQFPTQYAIVKEYLRNATDAAYTKRATRKPVLT